MTSRSGRASIFKRTDFAAQQALLYLESLPDLTLTLVAADAADESEMATAVKSLPGPIGGCMMLSMVLSDKLFSRHSESSYRASFPAKVGALEALEKGEPHNSANVELHLTSCYSAQRPIFGVSSTLLICNGFVW
jgi:hypothetical protein